MKADKVQQVINLALRLREQDGEIRDYEVAELLDAMLDAVNEVPIEILLAVVAAILG